MNPASAARAAVLRAWLVMEVHVMLFLRRQPGVDKMPLTGSPHDWLDIENAMRALDANELD